MSTVLGGSFNGQSVIKTQNAMTGGEVALKRKILRKSFGQNTISGTKSFSGPFRSAFHLGDHLGRTDYVCGCSNQVSSSHVLKNKLGDNVKNNCDNSGIALETGNSKYVSDSSLFTRFKGLEYINKNYNDNSR